MTTHRHVYFGSATWLVLVALTSGCGGTEKTPSTPPRRASARQPAAKPEPPPGTIVIRGRADQTPQRDANDERDWQKIAELEGRARASQGQPAEPAAPPHYAEKPAPRAADGPEQVRQQLEAELASLTKQIGDLQAEKESLMEDKRVRRGGRRVLREVSSDPERTKAIDAQLAELEGRKRALEQKLAELPR